MLSNNLDSTELNNWTSFYISWNIKLTMRVFWAVEHNYYP